MKRLLLHLIRGYRTWISPAHAPCCRYAPTCSTYALEALEKHGAWKGGVLSLWRVLRCNPFSRGGYDPVPAVWPAPRAISLSAKTEEREKPSWKAIS